MIYPNGCRFCGIDLNQHYSRYHPDAEGYVQTYRRGDGTTYFMDNGMHTWVQPTQEQIKARMLKRRLERYERQGNSSRTPR